jgi:prolyl-tRNA editing enzyme YbaK/EbsC (Cys-tRNA(Pro) deacylase)
MWPEPVERIAAFLRAAHVEGRIEELAPGVDSPAGTAFFAAGFEADGSTVVAILPGSREVDRGKLAAASGSPGLRPAPAPAFPFESARVLVDRTALAVRIVWLEAASGRHIVGLAPQQLISLTRAETADLLLDQQSGGG